MSVSVLENTACHLSEGPYWEESTKSLLYVDAYMGDIHKWNSVTGKDEQRHFDGGVAGFVVPRTAGGYVTTLDKSLRAIDFDTGNVIKTYHEDVDTGTPNRLNDGKCDASGRLWSGTFIPGDDNHDKETGSLFSLEKDGSLCKHIGGIFKSNGLAWTRDNRTMFYVDSGPRKVYAFDFDMEAGEVSNQRVFLDRSVPACATDTSGFPDGICMDAEGKLWIACYGVGKVIRVDCETAQVIRAVSFPGARYITSCCFGGQDYGVLYVTSARKRLTPEERLLEPLAGSVFKVTGLGVKGMAATEFAG